MRTTVFCLLILTFACSKQHSPLQNTETIKVDIGAAKDNLPPNQFFKDINYIILDEEEFQLGEVKQIVFTDRYIYVSDDFEVSVNQYDLDGNFLNQYKKYGEGPSELTYVDWISFDEATQRLAVYDMDLNKIVWLDEELNFISSERSPIMAHSFYFLPQDQMLFFANDILQDVENNDNLFLYNRKAKELTTSYLPIDMSYQRLSYDLPANISQYNNRWHTFLAFRYDIHTYQSAEMRKRLSFDLGKHALTKEEVSNQLAGDLFPKMSREEKYILNSFYEYDNTYIFTVTNFSRQYIGFYNKQQKSMELVKGLNLDESLFLYPDSKYKDYLVGFLSKEMIEDLANNTQIAEKLNNNKGVKAWKEKNSRGSIIMLAEVK